jgi:hypothetical protein
LVNWLEMRLRRPLLLSALALLLSAACFELPASFARVGFDEAHRLVADPAVSLVEISAPENDGLPGAIAWSAVAIREGELPELPRGAVLLVGADAPSAYRAAALLVRSGNRPVRVFVPGSRDERSRLIALATAKEDPRGEDS